jgi:predicted AAA+ superfamily ATPase
MAISNHERVGKAMDLLKLGLGAYIDREFCNRYRERAAEEAQVYLADDRMNAGKPVLQWDAAPLLKLMWDAWNEVFKYGLGQAERTLVSELRTIRNNWAHQQTFSSDDAYRALDSSSRLLFAISAPQADEIDRMKRELMRLVMDEQARGELRRSGQTLIESTPASALKPWREVIQPHQDVASGNYRTAEFAADLWQVHLKGASEEYGNPVEFFRRTYLTESLKGLLLNAIKRLCSTSGKGGPAGDPVIQLQTNFGGGKTHSMLALYHLFSGIKATELPGMEALLAQAGTTDIPAAKRVVLVGNRISPGNPSVKPDGTLVRTLWGELAWQLGGRVAYDRIAKDDERATNPGDALRELFNEYSPALILIDEWVAYARGLHDEGDLPAGDFETQFSFAQALTESAKLANNCLLVVSLPASDTAVSPHARVEDVEVGGQRGLVVLQRLQQIVGRVESSWRPATAEEGFEIVRRRLFNPLTEDRQFKDRDVTGRAFADFYRNQQQEFPAECRDPDYEQRLKAAYPIHPEVFDRLYSDWSTLVKFQRTRGVLRLMAAVIHSLWENGDKNPLIMPANIALNDDRIQSELAHYLSDNWVPVIEKDVDGPSSLPAKLDAEVPNLGRYSACRRVARTIYMGSAPTTGAANRGLDDRRVKLGCAMPGESPAVFGDALRRLSSAATYLYQDGARYWYSIQPTVTKLAEDRAELLLRNPDKAVAELEARVRTDLRQNGDFPRIHAMPHTAQDVPDDLETRLVVLPSEACYVRGDGSPAQIMALNILETRGSTPRLFRNTLVFLAPDQARLQDLDQAVRAYLAWKSILDDHESLNLTPHQKSQAATQLAGAERTMLARIPETWNWLLVPRQTTPQAPITWEAHKLAGDSPLALRAAKKLRSAELMITSFAPSLLRMEMDRIPLWRDDSVTVRQLVEDFARYLYLPRLRSPEVLVNAMREGISLLTWEADSFAYADTWDQEARRYRGLRGGVQIASLDHDSLSHLVRPGVALSQLEKERKPIRLEVSPPSPSIKPGATIRFSVAGFDMEGRSAAIPGIQWTAQGGTIDEYGLFTAGDKEGSWRIDAQAGTLAASTTVTIHSQAAALPETPYPHGLSRQPEPVRQNWRRYHGTVALEPSRISRETGKIAEEVIAHLLALDGAHVRITLEIEASFDKDVPDHVVRTVSENGRSLKFDSQGFERE